MAPEQLLALPDIDSLAQVYALGVTMFECLTGCVPYEGTYPRVLLQVCSEQAAPNIGERFPEVSEALAAVVQRAISKKREERLASVIELASALHDAIPSAGDQTCFLGLHRRRGSLDRGRLMPDSGVAHRARPT